MARKPDFNPKAYAVQIEKTPQGSRFETKVPVPGSRQDAMLDLTTLATQLIDVQTETMQEALNVSMSVAVNFVCSAGIDRATFIAAAGRAFDAWTKAQKDAQLADREAQGKA